MKKFVDFYQKSDSEKIFVSPVLGRQVYFLTEINPTVSEILASLTMGIKVIEDNNLQDVRAYTQDEFHHFNIQCVVMISDEKVGAYIQKPKQFEEDGITDKFWHHEDTKGNRFPYQNLPLNSSEEVIAETVLKLLEEARQLD